MMGHRDPQRTLFYQLSLETFVSPEHPLRTIRPLIEDAAIRRLPRLARIGRPSIPPEQLFLALVGGYLLGVTSERMLVMELQCNMALRWFVGLNLDQDAWDSGVAGGMAMNVVMLLTFRAIGFGWDGGGILLTSSIQSQKLVAVWTTLEPLPLVVVNPTFIVAGLVLYGIGHALIYRWLSAPWPSGVTPRALRFAGLEFFMTFLFWEFFTPFNLFGEPLPLIGLELCFWAAIAIAEAFAIAVVAERGRG